MKRILFLLSLPLLFTACGDKGGDPPTPLPTLPNEAPAVLLSRENPIRFSAAATESYTVTVTSDLAWKASSDKAWCKVISAAGKFTVSADPNTSDREPDAATVSIEAGGKTCAALTVTQEAELTEYPATIEKFTDAISKTWSCEGGPFESLTFMPSMRYVLVPRAKARSDAPGNEMISGSYSVSGDLRTLTLRDHELATIGTLVFSDLASESATVDFTPAGSSATRLSLKSSPVTDDRAPRRRLKRFRADVPDEGVFEYNLTWSPAGRLAAAEGSMGSVAKVNYALSYPSADRLIITAKGEVEGEVIDLAAMFVLDAQGRAVRMQMKNTSGVLATVTFAYRPDGRLGFYEAVDDRERFFAMCQTLWGGGDLVTEHVKSRFPWDENGDGKPDADFNGDGTIDGGDRILFSWNEVRYTYSQKENIAALMLPFEVYEVYAFDDLGSGFGYIGYLAGVMGPGTKHLLSNAGRDFRYEFDTEGYPTKVSVVDGSDSFDCTLEFAWPE